MFPEYWQRFADPIPEDERGDMVQAYHKRITGDDPEVHSIGQPTSGA